MSPMTRTLPLLLLAFTVAACTRDKSPEPALPAPAKPAKAPVGAQDEGAAQAGAGSRLTVYSGDYDALALQPPAPAPYMPGFALVEATLRYALQAGPNAITLDRLPQAIDVASITFRSDAPGARAYDLFVDCFEKGLLIRVTGDIVGYYDYGSSITLSNAGDIFTVDFDATNGVIQAS